jgi:galactokinase
VRERVTAFAPGRVNLIGEHTDYNDGLALPFAIAEGVSVRAWRGSPDRVEAIARDLDGRDSFCLRDPAPVRGWRAFVRGAVAELQAAGFQLTGCRLEVAGTVPRGSGLSSSAALEVAVCLALLAIGEAEMPDPIALARICSRVENEWVGAQTGLLDQIASLCGERERALRIDFRSLEVTPVVLDLGGYRLATLDSGERHTHAGDDGGDDADGYNERRAECARACRELGVSSLRDATLSMADRLPEPLSRRVRHVITENERVEAAVAALERGDMDDLGRLIDASHASLRDCYEVSTPAVEKTVRRCKRAGALGARIMGGGFGGHVIALLPPIAGRLEGAVEVRPGDGARVS